ncbi:MAG: hypothetical protein ACYDBH_00525 [Acidobacteriaceae bacterium]
MSGNEDFGLPPVDGPKASTRDERIAALRAKAAVVVDSEFDEEAMLKELVAVERAKREADLKVKAALVADEHGVPVDFQGFPKKYVEITVFKSQNAQDGAYAKGAVNGVAYQIERGVKVIVPSVIAYESLDHAVEDVTIQSEGGLITRPAHRFPFTVHRECTEAEYLAFRAECREKGSKAAMR